MERVRENQAVRKPKQKRSRLMTEKILDAGLALFCEKGYYNTTTNQIAQEAQVSIGSLYSYFKDKDTIFLEILKRYHQNFLSVFENIQTDVSQSIYRKNKREWLQILLNDLIKLHLSVKTLNRELKSLYYMKEEVKTVMDEQTEKIRAAALEFLTENPSRIQEKDRKAMSILTVDFISCIVDRVVFDDQLCDSEKKQIVNLGVNSISEILYK